MHNKTNEKYPIFLEIMLISKNESMDDANKKLYWLRVVWRKQKCDYSLQTQFCLLLAAANIIFDKIVR